MRKLLLVALTLLFSTLALGSTNSPSLVRVRARNHHAHHYKAHKAGRHHVHHRNRHGV